MRIKMQDIIGARQRLLNMDDSTFRAVRLLPIMEPRVFTPEDAATPKNEQSVPIVTVRYEQYGDMVVEVPDVPVTPDVEELAKLNQQIKEIKQILTIVKLNPMHDRNIQVTRALRCLEILNGETE